MELLSAVYSLVETEADPYRNLHYLLSCGEEVSLYLGSKKIGRCTSCTISDKGTPGMLRLHTRFTLTNPELLVRGMMVNPVVFECYFQGAKKFKLLKCFRVN